MSLASVQGQIVSVSLEEHRINQKRMFTAYAQSLDLTNGSFLRILVRTATPAVRMKVLPTWSGLSRLSVFSEPTVSSDGSAVETPNRNGQSSSSAGVLVFSGTTVSADGDLMARRLLAGAGAMEYAAPMILAPSTEYLVVLQNISGGAVDVGATLLLSEEF